MVFCAHSSPQVDDFLPPVLVAGLRREAEALRAQGRFATSQSTRWDAETGTVVSAQPGSCSIEARGSSAEQG